MELPIRFPNEADKIYEEAQAFRGLSPSERFLAIIDLIACGETMMLDSPHRETSLLLQQAQEEEWRRIQKDFFARYGR